MALSACSSMTSKLTSLPGKNLQHSHPLFLITTTYHMDSGNGPSRRHIFNYNERVPQIDTDRTSRTRQPHSSPLPQREWSAPPSPHRQQYRPRVEQRSNHDDRRSASTRHVYTTRDGFDTQNLQPPSTLRQRIRKRRVRDILFRRDVPTEAQPDSTDYSRLYPQMNPYDNRFSICSAPEDLEHEDEIPDIGYVSPSSSADLSPVMLPRSPTYPPATRSRSYNNLIDDAALADAAEFHLFVQATVGLGLDHGAAQADAGPSPVSWREPRGFETQVSLHDATSRSPVSPLEEASMTLRALQHMAQIPDGSHLSNPEPTTTRSQPARVASAPMQLTLEDFEDHNEDLPDYEESQTQAWSSRRAEATRRAQELQMRWRMTGARRGIM